MCCGGGGGGQMPSPEEMGAAQARFNRIDQYTPYGSLVFSGDDRNVSTQTLSPEMLQLQNSMMGLRSGALNQLMDRFGASSFDMQNPGGGGGGNDSRYVPYDEREARYDDKRRATRRIDGEELPDDIPPWENPDNYDENDNYIPPGRDPYRDPVFDPGGDRIGRDGLPPPRRVGRDDRRTPIDPRDPGGGGQQGFKDIPLDYDLGMDDVDFTEDRARFEQAFMDRARGLLDPVFDEQQLSLDERMANRGMPTGGEEGEILQGRLGRERGGAYEKAALDAILAGGNETRANRNMTLNERMTQFGAQSGARNQLFGEDTMGFNQLASILGMSQTPGASGDQSGFFGPGQVDMMSPYALEQQMNQANQGFGADILGGLLGLGGSLGGAYLGRR